ncbi:MAG: hypothetical protein P8I13_01325 [Porticoccaceae bacterium]|nr:hypothetical protein [Porticoccaceae bacterium]
MIEKNKVRPFLFSKLVRVGNRFDGGYVLPEMALNSCNFLLSLGINDDISFDLQFGQANKHIRCIGVDYTVTPAFLRKRRIQAVVKSFINSLLDQKKHKIYRAKATNIKKFNEFFTGNNTFLPLEVSDDSSSGKITISELINKCNSCSSHDVFLKMDIEGAEYKVTEDIINNANRIGYIAAEYHHIIENPERFNETINRLSEHFYLAHIHGNNHGAYSAELDFPDTVELTWVNKGLIAVEPPLSDFSYPISNLDNPCNHKKADYNIVF